MIPRLFKRELTQWMEVHNLDAKAKDPKFIGNWSHQLTLWQQNMSPEQREILTRTTKEWNEQGPPPDVQAEYVSVDSIKQKPSIEYIFRYRDRHLATRVKEFVQDCRKLMGVHVLVYLVHKTDHDDGGEVGGTL